MRDNLKSGQNGLKCVWEGVDIYKISKPVEWSFMKKLTHLQWFKYLAYFVKVILRPPGMSAYDFCYFFFSATILQCKQLKIEFYFSNEPYNK